jgi:hypothetical protein
MASFSIISNVFTGKCENNKDAVSWSLKVLIISSTYPVYCIIQSGGY